MTGPEIEEKIAKLPKWASQHIAGLEMRLREAQKAAREMSEGIPNAVAWADSYGEYPRPLEEMGRAIRFTANADITDWDHYIDVALESPGCLRVRCGRSLSIHPEVTNGLLIKVEPRR